MPNAFWIAADWGTSHLRVWRMDGHEAVDEARSDRGMGRLTPDAFEPALLDLIGSWLAGRDQVQVLACGMVGARQGWIEAPYAEIPAAPADPAAAVVVPVRDPRLDMRILPGLSQPDPPDVMRGEETQIAGLLLDDPGFEGLICLPGTHSKWVRVAEGRVVQFQTFMTGELFALLSGQSVLRHSMPDEAWNDAAFAEGFIQARGDAAVLARSLFAIRAAGLLQDEAPGTARARLSGLLIGAEFAAMGPGALTGSVAVVGAGAVADLYRKCFDMVGVPARVVTAETATLRGLCAARDALERIMP
ncbi:MAG: 2-dehydro-3-deoxygalactonokinase [Thalassovita sp.]|nr:2-dehydro-3-deoxygalactonokinase [Thalassovita sp.]